MQPSAKSLGFRKEERLCSRKEIDRVFAEGKSLSAFPLRLTYALRSEMPNVPVMTMFVVGRRIFRRAHDRNRLKRRMREAFRLHKADLYDKVTTKNTRLSVALIYTSKEESDFSAIERSIIRLLEKLAAAV
jgi:ribonuclease P protein component